MFSAADDALTCLFGSNMINASQTELALCDRAERNRNSKEETHCRSLSSPKQQATSWEQAHSSKSGITDSACGGIHVEQAERRVISVS